MPTIKQSQKGFSLIELSVVVLVIGVLIYMTLMMGRQQLEVARIKQTQYKLQKIQTALALFYRTYGRLPCPALGETAYNDPTFGTESGYSNPTTAVSDATCTPDLTSAFPFATIGVVPVQTLGMPNDAMIDGWGNRITYVVSKNCVDPDNWSAANTYKCTDSTGTAGIGGSISLKGGNGSKWTDKAAYVVISPGKAGYGGWSKNGTRNPGLANSSYAEAYNGNFQPSNGTYNPTTVSNNIYYDQQITDGNITGNYFDNIVAWGTAQQIYYTSGH